MTSTDVVFGERETIHVSELEPGDFICEMPAQRGVRGFTANSAIREISALSFAGGWRSGSARAKVRVESRRWTFLDAKLGAVDVPGYFSIVVRRPVGRLSLDDQLAKLRAEYEGACSDAAADNGEDIIDSGGWIELARAIVDSAGPEISDHAKSEFLRMEGVSFSEF